MEARPNVLLVVADQWRGRDQGWAGQTPVHTPNLDRLACDGVAVPGAVANTPVCAPSRASMLTGQLPVQHGLIANDLPLDPTTPTIASTLREAGYRTGWIGKWHLDGPPRDRWIPPDRRLGFQYWAGVNCRHRYLDAHYYADDGHQVPIDGYEPETHTALAIELIQRWASEPFFVTVSYGPPHNPYPDVPVRYLDRYPINEITTPPNVTDVDRDELRQYYAAVTAVDDQLGRLMDVLESTSLADNTLVIVTSDHGDMLGSHGLQRKQLPYQESIGVPLVMRWPGRLAPRIAGDGVMSLTDLGPTILGLVGAQELPPSYGRDLTTSLTNGSRLRDHALITNEVSTDEAHQQQIGEWRGLRHRRYTYARWADGTPWLLYDNERDPWQLTNLVGATDQASVQADLDRTLTRELESVGDPSLDGPGMIRHFGLTVPWNERESALHPNEPHRVNPNSTNSETVM